MLYIFGLSLIVLMTMPVTFSNRTAMLTDKCVTEESQKKCDGLTCLLTRKMCFFGEFCACVCSSNDDCKGAEPGCRYETVCRQYEFVVKNDLVTLYQIGVRERNRSLPSFGFCRCYKKLNQIISN